MATEPMEVDTTISGDPAVPVLEQDSTTTKAENIVRNGSEHEEFRKPSTSKRIRLDDDKHDVLVPPERQKGVAPIKAEYLLYSTASRQSGVEGDDAAEASVDRRDNRDRRSGKDYKKKAKGQNTSRKFGSSRDTLQLCSSRALCPEFSPKECKFGDNCKFCHDIRKYLREGKREALATFGGICPVWDSKGVCDVGWRCRFVDSHSEERETEDGRKELVLTEDPERKAKSNELPGAEEEVGVVNIVNAETRNSLQKRKFDTPKSEAYIQWINKKLDSEKKSQKEAEINGTVDAEDVQENRAQYVEPPFLPSEKRRIYYGPETPVLAPLTTQGNLPFRRLCVELGAQVTWSEMAMGLPLLQGNRSEWALMKAHESEIRPPKFLEKNEVVKGYDNGRDLKFGAQIAANKPWLASKAVEVLTTLCPHLRAIDLNCGCPIELVCETGSGSALLDSQSKLENILHSMNAVSNEVPITVKIRMGTKEKQPTAQKLITRLVTGGHGAVEAGKGSSGVAAITLHGRSKQQRYTKSANWEYISECAALINRLKEERSGMTDTMQDPDPRYLANDGKVYFVGNGDCYSHIDYYDHIEQAKVDSVMVARGALIKPWIFEEIEKGQYLDKSASERLTYVEKFAKYGLQTWGSDEMGVGTTRRFLLEWLSFAHRYVPTGLLEHLPPRIQDRPPAYKGRDDLETLMASENYKDWIKISEMFLGPAHPDFKFEPKHKSNSYEAEG